MKRRLVVCLVILAAVAVGWRFERQTAAQLTRERQAALRENQQLAALRAEHERLSNAQLSTAARDALLRDAAEANRLKKLTSAPTPSAAHASATRATAAPVAEAPRSSSSKWTNVTALQNRGRATPEAAFSTFLWAAANGEVGILRDTLELAPEARATLQAVLARLDRHKTTVPAAYASPEDLAALYTARDALAERVRVILAVGLDADHATVTIALETAGKTREATLSTHRTDGEWRLVMPAVAAQKIADELAGPAAGVTAERPPSQQ